MRGIYGRKTVESSLYLKLSMSSLRSRGMISCFTTKSHEYEWYETQGGAVCYKARLDFSVSKGWGDMNMTHINVLTLKPLKYRVGITETIPNYGGIRQWFLCPSCNSRKGVLYSYMGAKFSCRSCQNLAYKSQWEDRKERVLSKARNLHRKLGGTGVLYSGIPEKPYNMHWRTYSRQVEELVSLMEEGMSMAAADLSVSAVKYCHGAGENYL